MKSTSVFACTQCPYTNTKWLGQCGSCNSWNSMVERQPAPSFRGTNIGARRTTTTAVAPLTHLETVTQPLQTRMQSGIQEWDRVLGGGVLPGSFMIVTGDPGIGKSTLMLQVAHKLSEMYHVIYFSSEESLEQLRNRATRLNCMNRALRFSDHAHLDEIIATAEQEKPEILIIDSIQNCYSSATDAAPGSPSQLRDAAFRLLRLAKDNGIAVIVSGHITKDGTMAGPKTLEHMVDAVFYLQGEDRWQTRILRSVKNRFGTIDEIGFFEMHETGLRELPNINEQILAEVSHAPGAALISSLEGSKPLLVELQALTIATTFSMPQRVVTGIDQKQVMLIAAILEKYLHIKFSSQDIFFKVSGGAKLKGSSADLGIALSLLSSYFQKPLPHNSVALGEVSLTGHIKPISLITPHLNEARKFGFATVFLADQQKVEYTDVRIRRLKSVYDLLALFPVEEA